MTSSLLCVLIAVAVVTCKASQNPIHRMFIPRGDASGVRVTSSNDDRGIVANCGPKGFLFDVYWVPKNLDPEGKVTLYYNVTSPAAFSEGSGKFQLFIVDESEPIIEVERKIDCPLIKKYTPFVQCPIKKGDPLVGHIEERKLDALAGYAGNYRLAFSVKNDKQQMIICGKMNVTVL